MAMTAEEFARIAKQVEADLEKVAEDVSPVQTIRPHAEGPKQHPINCQSGKAQRKERKEAMREKQETDRLGNLESKLSPAGLEDGDLLGDFQGVTAHRAKPTTEYSTCSADRTPTLKVFKQPSNQASNRVKATGGLSQFSSLQPRAAALGCSHLGRLLLLNETSKESRELFVKIHRGRFGVLLSLMSSLPSRIHWTEAA
eukprot:symbB.v1.2.035733.t1/scaffold4875.1/size33575/4